MEAEVLRLAENDNLDLILTYRSDLMFPWSTDKAPWSRAQGGSGVVPSAARAKIKFEVDVEQGKEELLSKHPMWVALFKKRERALQALTGCVPSSKSIPEVW